MVDSLGKRSRSVCAADLSCGCLVNPRLDVFQARDHVVEQCQRCGHISVFEIIVDVEVHTRAVDD